MKLQEHRSKEAQVLVGGRGKAGGVKLAATPAEAEERAREIIGLDIKGTTVKTVLVAPAAEAASTSENGRSSPARAHLSNRSTMGSVWRR